MGKLKQAMIEAQERWNIDMPDMSADEIIKEDMLFRYGIDKEDVFMRYGIDIEVAQRVMTLLRAYPPPEHLYVTHPELHVVWLNEYIEDMENKQLSKQLDLFDEGDLPWIWER